MDFRPDPFKNATTEQWRKLVAANEVIGRFLEFSAREEFAVGTDNAFVLSPAHFGDGFDWPAAQKRECDRWMAEHKEYAEREGYKVRHLFHYPEFHRDWNVLIEAWRRIVAKHPTYPLPSIADAREAWAELARRCTCDPVMILELVSIPSTVPSATSAENH